MQLHTLKLFEQNFLILIADRVHCHDFRFIALKRLFHIVKDV